MTLLSDCGKTLNLHIYYLNGAERSSLQTVQMVIKAPHGTMALYEDAQSYEHYHIDTKCEAIRAFMEQHNAR
jgi:hypothetical protein